jgi:hypothetical protein
MKVRRYDKITLDRSKVIRLDNGMMRVPARLSRVGIQEYRRPNGTVERAYRPADEVAKSAPGFDAVTLVDDHPIENGSVVDASNAKRLSVGVVLNPVFREGFVEAELLISDATAVAKVEAGKVELSAGYFIDRDDTPGLTADGQHYDFVHRNIRPNHVAIVDEGRAGHDVRIQLDAAGDVAFTTDFTAPMVDAKNAGGGAAQKPAHSTGAPNMKKIVIDGVEVEVTDLAATMIQKEREMAKSLLDAQKAETATAKTAAETAKAQCDAANEKVTKLEAELKDLPGKLAAQGAERSAFETKAKAIAPDLKLDSKLDVMGIKRAVLAHAKIACDGKTDDYVSARFDVLAEEVDKKNPATEAAKAALTDPARKPETDSAETSPAKKARAEAEAEFFKKR